MPRYDALKVGVQKGAYKRYDTNLKKVLTPAGFEPTTS